jgi:hypothetical protein
MVASRCTSIATGFGTVRRHLQPDDAARPEKDLHAAALVDRAVTHEPQIAAQQIGMRLENVPQVRRSGLLLPLEKKLEVHRKWNLCTAQGIDGGEQRHDGRLVVADRTAVHPPLRFDRESRQRPVQIPCPVTHFRITDHRLPWIGLPLLRHHRLTVVMGIQDQGMLRPGRQELAEHRWWGTFHFQAPGPDSAFVHHLFQPSGVPQDVFGISRDVGDRHQVGELRDDSALPLADILPSRVAHRDHARILRPDPSGSCRRQKRADDHVPENMSSDRHGTLLNSPKKSGWVGF